MIVGQVEALYRNLLALRVVKSDSLHNKYVCVCVCVYIISFFGEDADLCWWDDDGHRMGILRRR